MALATMSAASSYRNPACVNCFDGSRCYDRRVNRYNADTDWLTLKEVSRDAPLDPASLEARNIEQSLVQITSANLAQVARKLLQHRYEKHTPPAA